MKKAFSLETRAKMRAARLGTKHSIETRFKIRKAMMGIKFPPRSMQACENIRNRQLGKKASLETRKKMSKSMIGLKRSEQTCKNISESKKGEKSPFWQGGITSINASIRSSSQYRQWREAVFTRDKWTCVWCGIKKGNKKNVTLNADHIKPFAYFPELRFDINNGRTLCVPCHKKTDTYANKVRQLGYPLPVSRTY